MLTRHFSRKPRDAHILLELIVLLMLMLRSNEADIGVDGICAFLATVTLLTLDADTALSELSISGAPARNLRKHKASPRDEIGGLLSRLNRVHYESLITQVGSCHLNQLVSVNMSILGINLLGGVQLLVYGL